MSVQMYDFFLGGSDLEMEAVRALITRHAPGHLHDRQLSWGAAASAYQDEIKTAFDAGRTPVLVELDDDVGAVARGAVCVDHHGDRAAGPTAVEQVFALLGRPPQEWTRQLALVAANDRGHIAALLEMGATAEEIARIRAADRAAQGTTADEEAAAERAIAQAERQPGGLTLVRLPHARTAPVADRLHAAAGGAGYDTLAIISPDEVNVYGSPALVAALAARYAGGWRGSGYWGLKAVPSRFEEDLASLVASLPGRAT